jgi:hypothetical protein
MNTSNNINRAVRDLLEAGIVSGVATDKQQQKLNETRSGTYSSMVAAGIAAGTGAEGFALFARVWDGLKDDIQKNRDGIAAKLRCPKRSGKKGGYKVPSAASSAASVVSDALQFGVSMGTADEPETFTAIRNAVQEAKHAAWLETVSSEERKLFELLAELSETANSLKMRYSGIVSNGMVTDATQAAAAGLAAIADFDASLTAAIDAAKDAEPESEAGEAVAEAAEAKTTRRRKAS